MSDFQDFFRLKCDVDNVIWSGATKPPAYEFMEEWYVAKMDPDSGRTILIAVSRDTVIGYAYVDEVGAELEITVGLAASEARRMAFRPILALVLDWVEKNCPGRPVFTWLYDSNRFLTAAFEQEGFVMDPGAPPHAAFTAATGAEERQSRWRWMPKSAGRG